jgi:calcineurin-like phosphoesterase
VRILFIGDIVGRSGRAAVVERLPGLMQDWQLDFVVINGENAAGGFGSAIHPGGEPPVGWDAIC